MYFSGGHYRQPIAYGELPLAQAANNVARLREAGRRLTAGASPPELAHLRERFFAALADDFNTAEALPSLWEWVREANRRAAGVGSDDLRAMLDVLGLANLLDAEEGAPAEIVALAHQRVAARAAGDYTRADVLRAEIEAAGWAVRDEAGGFSLVPG
jgi:cysteinyl-tRNA synthetase